MSNRGQPHAGGEADLVKLDPDHPGFRDRAYRERRNAIAHLALTYQAGEPVPDAPYTEEEHRVWQEVWRHLGPMHERWACREYLACSHTMALDRTRIPQLSAINRTLAKASGVQMLPVAGLVSARRFLEYLGRDVFLSTQYIRHHSVPLYTPEPDVVHELVGHAATFTHPHYVRLNRAFGAAAARADDARIVQLERLYWYTLEFGVVRENGQLKGYGAGLLSSFGELERFATTAELRPLIVEEAIAMPYDPTTYQKILFVSDTFDEVLAVCEWLERT
jgi:phenylalanine-4-hydroxylase